MEIKPKTVCQIVFLARELFAEDDVLEGMEDSEAHAERHGKPDAEALESEIHEEFEHDPIYAELTGAIDELPEDEQCELVALAWLGRGDGTKADWNDLVSLATERHSDHTATYLLGMPLLATYLEDGLEAFDISCEDFED